MPQIVVALRRQLLGVGPARRRPRPDGIAHADPPARRSEHRARERDPRRAVRLAGSAHSRRRRRGAGDPLRHALRRPGALPDRGDPRRSGPSRRRRGRDPPPFTAAYGRTFGHTMDGAVETVALRATLRRRLPRGAEARAVPATPDGRAHGDVEAYSSRAASGCPSPSRSRSRIEPGETVEGPMIILEETATTYLDAGYRATVDDRPARSSSRSCGIAQAEPVVYRAGQVRAWRRGRRSDHHRDHPPRPQLRGEPDQAVADPHVVLPDHLRGPRLRRGRLRPAVPCLPRRRGRLLHGDDELHRGGGRRRRRRGPARPGDIILMNDPYKTGSHPQDAAVVARLPRRRDADRLLGDQGALDGHRREADLLHRHDGHLAGGDDLPGREALPARASSQEDIFKIARELPAATYVEGDINAEIVGVRTGAAAFVRLARALRPRALRAVGRADVRPRRGRRAELL